MDKVLWIGLIAGLAVVLIGFAVLPINTEPEWGVVTKDSLIEADVEPAEQWGASEPQQGLVTVNVVAPEEPTDPEKILEYLNEHPVDDFKNTSDRFKSIELVDGTAHISYYTDTADPFTESFYWFGVVYKALPDVQNVWVYGYNSEDVLITVSKRYHPGREGYFFDQYRWFD